MPIYLDNSSTTFPKQPAVVEAIARKTAEGQYPENLWA